MSVARQLAAAPPGALQSVAETIRRESGIVLGPAQLPALAASISRAAPGLDAAGLLRELDEPVTGPALLERVIDEVTVKETYFLRHRSELDPIDWHALHAAARRNGSPVVRVWSAACATGEEVYSLALLAVQAFAPAVPPVRILGTDIAPSALRRAASGAYGWRSVRGVEQPVRELHFRCAPDGLVVSPALREVTSFARHNLVQDPIPPAGTGPFELIVCRNVLIYFGPGTVATTRAALDRALAPEGHLVLGAADLVSGEGPALRPVPGEPAAGPPRPPAATGTRRRGPRVPSRRRTRPTLASPHAAAFGASGASLEEALAAAEAGLLDEVIPATDGLTAADPLDPSPHFVRGLAEHAAGDAAAAVISLRRAVFLEPGFVRASFELARAHESAGDPTAAARSYEHVLAALDGGRPGRLLKAREAGDIAAASRGRLRALAVPRGPGARATRVRRGGPER